MPVRSRVALLAVAAAGLLTVPAGGGVRPVAAEAEVARLPAAAAQLYADTTLFPRPTKWRDGIPWVLDLEAGIRLAREGQRPLLLWTSGDDPLERC